jgi:hypothetical protein
LKTARLRETEDKDECFSKISIVTGATGHGPEHVEGASRRGISFILCPFMPAGRHGPAYKDGTWGHLPVKELQKISAEKI